MNCCFDKTYRRTFNLAIIINIGKSVQYAYGLTKTTSAVLTADHDVRALWNCCFVKNSFSSEISLKSPGFKVRRLHKFQIGRAVYIATLPISWPGHSSVEVKRSELTCPDMFPANGRLNNTGRSLSRGLPFHHSPFPSNAVLRCAWVVLLESNG